MAKSSGGSGRAKASAGGGGGDVVTTYRALGATFTQRKHPNGETDVYNQEGKLIYTIPATFSTTSYGIGRKRD